MKNKQAFPFIKHGLRWGRFTRSMLAMIALGACAIGWGAVSALAQRSGRPPAVAIAAHTISVHEAVHTSEVISHRGNSQVNERGRGTGTFDCSARMEVKISYTNGTADLTCSMSSGTVTGGGTLAFFTAGPTATFTGTMAIARGTGKYAHASGRLHVEGSMVRKTFALSATMSGRMSY